MIKVTENWRDIEGYEGKYQVSDMGRVRALNYNHTGECRILNVSKDKDGYHRILLWIGGKDKAFSVHRLVAKAFLEPIEGKDCVDHINGIRDDNRVENLRWCTNKENSGFELARKHKSEAQNRPDVKVKISGKNNHRSRAVIQMAIDGTIIRRFETTREAEHETGWSHANISRCCQGIYKTCGGYRWEYEKTESA